MLPAGSQVVVVQATAGRFWSAGRPGDEVDDQPSSSEITYASRLLRDKSLNLQGNNSAGQVCRVLGWNRNL